MHPSADKKLFSIWTPFTHIQCEACTTALFICMLLHSGQHKLQKYLPMGISPDLAQLLRHEPRLDRITQHCNKSLKEIERYTLISAWNVTFVYIHNIYIYDTHMYICYLKQTYFNLKLRAAQPFVHFHHIFITILYREHVYCWGLHRIESPIKINIGDLCIGHLWLPHSACRCQGHRKDVSGDRPVSQISNKTFKTIVSAGSIIMIWEQVDFMA